MVKKTTKQPWRGQPRGRDGRFKGTDSKASEQTGQTPEGLISKFKPPAGLDSILASEPLSVEQVRDEFRMNFRGDGETALMKIHLEGGILCGALRSPDGDSVLDCYEPLNDYLSALSIAALGHVPMVQVEDVAKQAKTDFLRLMQENSVDLQKPTQEFEDKQPPDYKRKLEPDREYSNAEIIELFALDWALYVVSDLSKKMGLGTYSRDDIGILFGGGDFASRDDLLDDDTLGGDLLDGHGPFECLDIDDLDI